MTIAGHSPHADEALLVCRDARSMPSGPRAASVAQALLARRSRGAEHGRSMPAEKAPRAAQDDDAHVVGQATRLLGEGAPERRGLCVALVGRSRVTTRTGPSVSTRRWGCGGHAVVRPQATPRLRAPTLRRRRRGGTGHAAAAMRGGGTTRSTPRPPGHRRGLHQLHPEDARTVQARPRGGRVGGTASRHRPSRTGS